jgi:hypothetical protein
VKEGAYIVWVGKLEGKRPLARPSGRYAWGMDWIDLAQDRDRWQTLVTAVMNLQIP